MKLVLLLVLLYVGKEIVDEVIFLIDVLDFFQCYFWILVVVELVLVVFFDFFLCVISLLDGLLGDLFVNCISVLLIKYVVELDLYQFEELEFYDKFECVCW